MPNNSASDRLPVKRSLKKGPGLLISIAVISTLCFLGVVIWVNWPKARPEPAPLRHELKSLISRIPGKSDALIYIGMQEIRKSAFWQTVVPDSMKNVPFLGLGKRVDSLAKSREIVMSEDIDTLLLSFQRGKPGQNEFLAVVSGRVSGKISESSLKAGGAKTSNAAGRPCYAIDRDFWLCPIGGKRVAVSSSKKLIEQFLDPSGNFFQRDSLCTALIGKALYKSQLWFVLPSAEWTGSALQSLMSANRDMKEVGNLNRIRHMVLSTHFGDGIETETEWVYETRRAAFFASTFLWGAAKLAALSESRTGRQRMELLKTLHIQQNLESVVIRASLPKNLFRKEESAP